MKYVSCLVLCFLFTAAIAIGWTEEIITIKRSGAVSNSRSANTSLIVRVAKHTDNRELEVGCESADFYTSHGQTIEGENTPVEIRFEFNLPLGTYECRAILTRNTDGKKSVFPASIKFFVY